VADQLRADAFGLVPALRAVGVEHVALVTGDTQAAAGERVGRELGGVDRVYADQAPADKLDLVRSMHDRPGRGSVVMVGDGVNDAPRPRARRRRRGHERPGRDDLIRDRRCRDRRRPGGPSGRGDPHRPSLAGDRPSGVLAGMGLSLVAMGFAAAGFIPPVAGAFLQEGIDVGVILNALRALSG
jgi:cation transport ATPase